MTDTATPHLRLVVADDSTPGDTRWSAARTADLVAQIDRLVADLTKEAAAAGPEALVHAHKQLGLIESLTGTARANAAATIHEYIQAHGDLPPNGRTYRVLNIGGTVYKAKADSGGQSMTADNAIRMWASFTGKVLAGHDADTAVDLVTGALADGADLAAAVDKVRQTAVKAALREVERCYGVCTGTGGKNARSGALKGMDVEKHRYTTSGNGNVTLTFEPFRGAAEAIQDDLAELTEAAGR